MHLEKICASESLNLFPFFAWRNGDGGGLRCVGSEVRCRWGAINCKCIEKFFYAYWNIENIFLGFSGAWCNGVLGCLCDENENAKNECFLMLFDEC